MYHITIVSKNKSSLNSVSTLLNSINNNTYLNLNTIKKYLKKKNKKSVLTILKSPHVNKTAQEQFEFKFSSKQFLIKPTTQNLKFILVLKKLESNVFPDTKIILKFVSNRKLKKKKSKIFNINNFKIKQRTNPIKRIETVLNIFDIYGELQL
jgi:ribosomal protein S10